MQIISIVAIYWLVWVMTAFVMLPFGVQTHDEAGIPKIPGQADSAPANFRPGRHALIAAIIATPITALFVLNYTYGWIGIDVLDLYEKLLNTPS